MTNLISTFQRLSHEKDQKSAYNILVGQLGTNFKRIESAIKLSPNGTTDMTSLPIGTVLHSMLNLSQFQSTAGSGWIISDGSSCVGTAYASITGNSTVPDMRGRFLRGKGTNNPDGDLALGTYTADKFKSHTHTSGGPGGGTVGTSGPSGDGTYSTGLSGGNETAPASITVNIFIRVN